MGVRLPVLLADGHLPDTVGAADVPVFAFLLREMPGFLVCQDVVGVASTVGAHAGKRPTCF